MFRKTLYLLIFLFSILGKDIAGLGLNIWYWNNKAEITRKYCENKSRPMMHCDGQCYLAKKLARVAFQEYQKENQKNKPVKPAKTLLFNEVHSINTVEVAETPIVRSLPGDATDGRNTASYHPEIFHPPAA